MIEAPTKTLIGSKYPIFEVSSFWFQKAYLEWFWGPESLNVGYLDPLGKGSWQMHGGYVGLKKKATMS